MVRKRLSNFVTTFAGFLGAAETIIDVSEQLEEIRHAMLSCLSDIPAGTPGLDKTWGAIARAGAAQSLWYLRSDLLALLADHRGEVDARKDLANITQMFRGVIPESLLNSGRKPKK
jgi:hypothetical protein